jgi:hypothetical protein
LLSFSGSFPILKYSIPPIKLIKIIVANVSRDRLTAWLEVTPSFIKNILNKVEKPTSLIPKPAIVIGIVEIAFIMGTKIRK